MIDFIFELSFALILAKGLWVYNTWPVQ